MAAIYEPSGAAREYSPLALNYISGCDHGCVYCYVPLMMKRFNKGYEHSKVYLKEESKLKKEILLSAKKYQNSENQVFLSFTTDPYSTFNNETKFTRWVLEVLLDYKIPVSILTKGGLNILQDLDVILKFGKNIQIGASLTFDNEIDSLKWEKNAALPNERLLMLKILNENGIRTWVSMEPVIYPDQSINLIDRSFKFVDYFKVGKLNHFKKHEDNIDWKKFLNDVVLNMRLTNKMFYIKKDLLIHRDGNLFLNQYETEIDFFALKKWE